MPALKLYHIDWPGRADAIRLTLRLGGIPFEDIRFPIPDLPERKSEFPFGQVPCLEVDGVMLPQTEAILRYAGRLANFYPSDTLEAARVDSVVAFLLNEVFGLYCKWCHAADPDKPAIANSIVQDELPKLFALLDKYIASITGTHYVATEMSIADILLFHILYRLESGGAVFLSKPLNGFVEKFPALNKIYDAVLAYPGFKELL